MDVNGENKTEIIDAYLNGKLTDEEVIVFKRMLENDAQLREDVAAQKAIISYLEEKGRRNKLLTQMDAFHLELNNEALEKSPTAATKLSVQRFPRWLAVAASVLLLVGIGYLWISTDNSKSPVVAENVIQLKVGIIKENDSLGFASKEGKDSTVIILKSDPNYSKHFRFKTEDTLELYGFGADVLRNDIEFNYNPDTTIRRYTLQIGKEVFKFDVGYSSIKPLE